MNRSRENLPVTISADWRSPIISATIYLKGRTSRLNYRGRYPGFICQMIERICDWIWGPKLSIDDPLFGNLVTQRIKGRGRPVGDPPEYAWIANPLRNPWAELDQVIIHGDVNGPNASHRNGWTKLLSKSDEFQAVLAKKLFENYEWNKQHLIAGSI